MPAPTLEWMRDHQLKQIEVSAMVIREGLDNNVTARLDFMRVILEDAIDTQKRIEKRNKRNA